MSFTLAKDQPRKEQECVEEVKSLFNELGDLIEEDTLGKFKEELSTKFSTCIIYLINHHSEEGEEKEALDIFDGGTSILTDYDFKVGKQCMQILRRDITRYPESLQTEINCSWEYTFK